jgi:hypothetical protein
LEVYRDNARAQCGDPEAEEQAVHFIGEDAAVQYDFVLVVVEEGEEGGLMRLRGEVMTQRGKTVNWEDAVITGYDPDQRGGGAIQIQGDA